jgi:catechol 2,3-dioxygenase-like lactoylglutathione lyase family enzyme
MKLDHVGLNVADLPAMTSWYAAALKLDVEFEFALDDVDFSGVMLRSPEGYRLELLSRLGNIGGLQAANPVEAALTRGFGHVAFDVPDVDAAYDALLAAGATDRMSPRPSPEPGVRMAYVADPEGNLVELLDRTSASVVSRLGASAPHTSTTGADTVVEVRRPPGLSLETTTNEGGAS